ncbi:MAG: hypothetical protein KDA61_00755, partial [Planctomycetales bacterium]|nr:hypothetical protein [Planctomycetales bacterium]
LYEYDHQYLLLEQETETLRQQNLALKSAAAGATAGKRSLLAPSGQAGQKPSPLEFQPRPENLPFPPEPMLDAPQPQRGAQQDLAQPESILEPSGSSRTPKTPSAGGGAPSDSASDELPTPKQNPVNPPRLPNSDGAELPPPSSAPSSNVPADPNAPRFPQPRNDGTPDFDMENLQPPTIDPGVPGPPRLPPVSLRVDGSPIAPEDDLEMNLAHIEIPPQRVPAQLVGDKSLKQATLQIAKEKVTDRRVVELAFHPTLSRAIDMDDRPDDDGLYLVLQPKNERGQMVPVAADLTVFALDPARQGEQAKIGRWEYSAAEVQDKLQLGGSEQGIHLRLPWNGPDPSADRVIVFALYKFDNGRQVMGEKEIFISSDGSHKTVWAPRASKAPLGTESQATSQVAQASFSAPSLSSKQQASQATPVVRPANGAGTRQPPPLPQIR